MKLNSHNWKHGVAAFAVAAIGSGSVLLAQKDEDPTAPDIAPPAVEKDTAPAKEKTKRKARARVVVPDEAPANASGFLGVATRPLEASDAAGLGIIQGSGLVVEYLVPDSPASEAGIEVDDVLHKVDDQILFHGDQLRGLIAARKPGDEVSISLIRGKEAMEVKAKLVSREAIAGAKPGPGVAPDLDPLNQQPAAPGRGLLPRGGGLRFQFPGGGAAGANAQSKAMISDDSGSYEITNNNGEKHLKATDPQGKVLFDGPINTEEELKKVPAGVLEKVEMMKVEVHPFPGDLDVDAMLQGLLGDRGRFDRGRARLDRMLKMIEQMGGNVRGFDDDRLRELFKPFGVEIPEFDGGGQEPGEVKPAPRAPLKKLVDPKTIN